MAYYAPDSGKVDAKPEEHKIELISKTTGLSTILLKKNVIYEVDDLDSYKKLYQKNHKFSGCKSYKNGVCQCWSDQNQST